MILSRLLLADFRNIAAADLSFSSGMNLLYGQNAQGKTNVLEAVMVCATGRSHRTRLDGQLVQFEKKEAHIRAFVDRRQRIDKIDVHLKKEEKKGVAINGVSLRRSGELFGTLHTVLFSPEDLQLMKQGPAERRRFLDMELCQLSRVYYHNLQQYYKVLKQRNRLLKSMQKQRSLKDTLDIWDEQLEQYASQVIRSRASFAESLSDMAKSLHHGITNGLEELQLQYRPNCTVEELRKKWKQNLEKDILYGNTSHGPQKDDLVFLVNGMDVKLYGSQGQQRTAALSAKLAEISLIQQEAREKPILLLDDVLSELDEHRQQDLVETIHGVQTILTCTGVEGPVEHFAEKARIFHVKQGKILLEKY